MGGIKGRCTRTLLRAYTKVVEGSESYYFYSLPAHTTTFSPTSLHLYKFCLRVVLFFLYLILEVVLVEENRSMYLWQTPSINSL